MLVEYFNFIDVLLFKLTGGAMLTNTFYIIPWIVGWTFLIAWIVLQPVQTYVGGLIRVCLIVFCFVTVLAPIGQANSMNKCQTVPASATLPDGNVVRTTVIACRTRTNTELPYGGWSISAGTVTLGG